MLPPRALPHRFEGSGPGGGGSYLSPLSREPPCLQVPHTSPVEIERKFLVDELPDLSAAASKPIEQGYLATGDAEVRLRRRGEDRLLTVKAGSGLSRKEAEIGLGEDQFETLWPLTEGRRLRKRRHLLSEGDLEIELDVYEGGLEGLVVAEVEFESEPAAEGFSPPSWLGAEVTGEDAYLNWSLATRGLPAPD